MYARDLSNLLEGDVSVLDIDREFMARDTSLFYLKPEIIVYPKNVKDIQTLIKYVSDIKDKGLDISITPRSAGTDMTGGPLSQFIVVSFMKYMNHVLKVDENVGSAESGVFYRDFEKETLKKGWIMPSYPASREIAAIGGIVANNSGGEKTLVYGKTEDYVKELNVVFANGEIGIIKPLNKEELENKMNEATENGRIHKEIFNLIKENEDLINKSKPTVSKNSSGYYLWNVYNKETGIFDLNKLIVGSQGTLALITSATLTGVPPKNHSRMIIMFLKEVKDLGVIVNKILAHNPETVESYDDHTFNIAFKFLPDIAKKMGGTLFSLGFQFLPELWMVITGGVPRIILMAEFTGDSEEDVITQTKKAYEDMKQFNCPIKMTKKESEAKKYWTFRRESFALLRSKLSGYRTAPSVDDIIVHVNDLPEFLPKLQAVFDKYDLIYSVAGHMGNANFHIIPLIDMKKEGVINTVRKLMEEVYDLVISYHGSISGEHNDGLIRTPYLSKMFNEDMIKVFEKTKNIFDPKNILNPGKKVHGDKEFTWKHVDTK
jgi:FAD/FMN-containing dehydrogenase